MAALSPFRWIVVIGYAFSCGILLFQQGIGDLDYLSAAPFLLLALVWLVLPVAILALVRSLGAISPVGALILGLMGIWAYSRDQDGYAQLWLPIFQLGAAALVIVAGYAYRFWGKRSV